MMNKYKIICICQVYNELERGNLERFFNYANGWADDIVIYDDASTDGSFEYALSKTKHVIRADRNDFESEVAHRQLMLSKAQEIGADFVFWLDADEVIQDGAREKLEYWCRYCHDNNYDAVEFHEINLWRSATWRRVDSLFDDGWFCRLWKVDKNIKFDISRHGLHQRLHPDSIKNIVRSNDLSILHYGFSSDKNLAYKYFLYKQKGQRGYDSLDRIIDESKLVLEKVSETMFPIGLYEMGDIKPIRRVFEDALSVVFEYREEFLRPKYTIACLIYKSVDWLKFVYDQILKYTDLSDKEFYFIANDANHEVLGYLTKNRIPHHVFNNTSQHSEEWYINNVYRAYNYAVKMAKGDFIVLINSDMAFSPDWFESLVSSYNGNNCVASRLVESGKFPSGQYGVEKNFGRQVSQYQEGDFIDFCKLVSESKSLVGGLFMPLFFKKEHFLAVGGYPEGNIKIGSDIFHPIIAKKEDEQISGDLVLIKKLETIGVSRVTSFGSLVYHFQCGELDELTNNERFTNLNVKNIAICNDIAGGSMGEKVFWNFLLDEFEDTYAIDYGTVHSCDGDFSIKANEYIKNKFHDTKVILQNATFIDFVSKDYFTIVFLQDDLRSMNRKSFQQEYNLKSADLIVANSMKIAASYRDFDCEVISIGIDEKLFDIKDKMFCRNKHSFDLTKKIGIFVGNFSEVKGWLEVKSCIQSRPDIFWILVTKNNENFIADNVVVYSRIKQELLVELLNCANFFIIGSLIETQCLAALEACLCGVPVVMHNTGIFSSFTDDDRDRLGYFGDNLLAGIDTVLSKNYNTREVIISKELTKATTLKRWDGLLSACVTIHNARSIRGGYDIERDVKSKHSLFYRKFLYYLEVYIYPNKEFNLKKILITHLKKIGIYNFIRKIYLFFRD